MFSSVMAAGAKKVLLTIDEVGPMGGGDTIYERSHYCFYKADGSVFDQGKYVPIVLYNYISVWGPLTKHQLIPMTMSRTALSDLHSIMAYAYASSQSRV